jgi:hypothetical protein
MARWSCWWVGTSLEAVAHCGASLQSGSFEPVPSPREHGLLYSSPRSEPIVQISRNLWAQPHEMRNVAHFQMWRPIGIALFPG